LFLARVPLMLALAWLLAMVWVWPARAWLLLTWGGGGFLRTLSGIGGTPLSTARAVRCRCPWPMAARA
jgi:hypothetical protein